ncbi:uncharacterized protein LOC107617175 isoform X1 [Arachis ipaensis]|uniref:uncharacterized protein LOC107617175 isoform X1 n=1 Tax=Arachis ipaensis TaxID=130454 RepID=UPI000A2B7F5E|nr:uncharacterized protein LOC107617175 isoform X1 [Arachis ipaensis]
MILTKPNWFISAPICYLNKEQDGDLALQMKINACYSWIFQCLPQLKKLFLLNIRKKERRSSKNVWGLPSNVYNGRQRSCKLIRNTFLFSDPKQQLHLHAYHAFSSLFSHHEGRRRDLARERRDHGERFRE